MNKQKIAEAIAIIAQECGLDEPLVVMKETIGQTDAQKRIDTELRSVDDGTPITPPQVKLMYKLIKKGQLDKKYDGQVEKMTKKEASRILSAVIGDRPYYQKSWPYPKKK